MSFTASVGLLRASSTWRAVCQLPPWPYQAAAAAGIISQLNQVSNCGRR